MNCSRFWYFCSNSSVNFSVFGREIFSISNFERGMLLKGSWRLKLDLLRILYRHLEVLINLYYQLNFLFFKGNRSVVYIFCVSGFCCVLFSIRDEYGNG